MSLLYELMTPRIAQILIVGLVFIIAINAIKTTNYSRKGVWILIFGLCFDLIFLGGFIYDFINNPTAIFTVTYFSYPIIIGVYTILISGFYLINAKKLNMRYRTYEVPIKKDSAKSLFIIYQYEDVYLLKKDGSKLQGDIQKFRKSKYYHDEEIDSFVKEKQLLILTSKMMGKVTKVHKRKDEELFCYLIQLSHMNEYTRTLEQVNKYRLLEINTDDETRQILLRMAIKESFDIKI